MSFSVPLSASTVGIGLHVVHVAGRGVDFADAVDVHLIGGKRRGPARFAPASCSKGRQSCLRVSCITTWP